MVAVCPSCHDAIHNGPLKINDDTVRRWKAIEREQVRHDHVYVEPGGSPKLLLGTIAVTGDRGVTAFELGPSTKLEFRLEDGDIMLVNLAVANTAGEEILRVIDGHVRHTAASPATYERVPGRVSLTAPATDEFMHDWAMSKLRDQEPDFAADRRITLLDLEVLKPGFVRVRGIWNDKRQVIAITNHSLSFIDPDRPRPIALVGHGERSVLHYTGPITTALFGFADESEGSLQVPRRKAPKPNRNDPCWCGSGRKFKKCHGR